jgi:lipopolysaccharide transport system ATP-binding protein
MTLPNPHLREQALDFAQAQAQCAIRMRGISKVYKLYDSPRSQLLDQSGLHKLMFWRTPPKYHNFHALKEVDLSVEKGERVGIIGRNGAGKTTLLKLITGNFSPTAGTLEVDGSVQALMQLGVGFHQDFSGYENIRAALAYNGLTGGEYDAALADIIDFVELGEFLHQPMKTYSLGMNARVQFAAATAIKPDILIIDEVMGAGDQYFAAKSAHRMRKIAKETRTLIMVSHSMQQIIQFCTRAIWLDQGQVQLDGPVKEVVGAYEVFSEERLRSAQVQAQLVSSETQASDPAPQNVAAAKYPTTFRSKKWIAAAIEEKESELVRRTAGKNEECAKPSDHCDQLENGLIVHRWPGKIGVKITRLEMFNGERPDTTFRHGDDVSIRMKLLVETATELRCRYFFSFFDVEARRVAWITSPIDVFRAPVGGSRFVSADLGKLLLGAGDFILSASIFDDVALLHLSRAHRFDLLARCLEFKVLQENDVRDAPAFHYPASWTCQAPV